MKADPNWLIPLKQGFLTWGASTPRGCWNQFRGCWGRSHVWR